MKLMIASDLHGSAYYCRALLDAFAREGAEQLVLLGDLLYHGPRNPLPKDYDTMAVTAMLNSMADKLLCVRGNCDAEVDQMVLQFPMMAADCCISVDGRRIRATHGHANGPENPPPMQNGDILLCGHFHLPINRSCGTYSYWNPGSLSLPKDSTPHSYMMLVDGVPSWHDVETGEEFKPLD